MLDAVVAEDFREDLRAQLEYFRDLGFRELFLSKNDTGSDVAGVGKDRQFNTDPSAYAPGPPIPVIRPGTDAVETNFSARPSVPSGFPSLEAFAAFAAGCPRCRLSAGRTRMVLGQGNPKAALMFVGEAPGADEDEQGLAFVGRAGQLLTKIIEAMGRTRGEVYIANVLKCRPPENRNPEPDEVEACLPYLREQIRLIAPRVLVTLGAFATQAILETDLSIGRLRGRFHSLGAVKVMPTYHPAFLLRSPDRKKTVWEDMKKVRDFLGSGASENS